MHGDYLGLGTTLSCRLLSAQSVCPVLRSPDSASGRQGPPFQGASSLEVYAPNSDLARVPSELRDSTGRPNRPLCWPGFWGPRAAC